MNFIVWYDVKMTLATIASFGFDDIDTAEVLGVYRELGCETCQYYRNEGVETDVDEVMGVVGEAGLRVDSIHGLFGNDYDPSSPDDAVRQHAIETYQREGELALKLGGGMVVVHPSPVRRVGVELNEKEVGVRRANLKRSLEVLARFGEGMGVTYLIENQPGNAYVGNQPMQVVETVRDIGAEHLRMCFDFGHAYILGFDAQEVEAIQDVIGYYHVHDNDGQVDSHEMPGEGRIDWAALGDVLHKNDNGVPRMLEVFYSPEDMRQYLGEGYQAKFRRWLNL